MLGRFPIGRHRTLLKQRLLASTVMLLGGRRPQGRVDDLTTARNETLLEQLRRDAIEEFLRARLTNPALEVPHCGAVRDGDRIR